MRAVELLSNKFGVSQLYQHDVKKDGEVVLTIFWHPLTIAERESIQKKSGNTDDANNFALYPDPTGKDAPILEVFTGPRSGSYVDLPTL